MAALRRRLRLRDPLRYERRWWDMGTKWVAGVDEVGRGPLAGPVVAAAVILPADVRFRGATDFEGSIAEGAHRGGGGGAFSGGSGGVGSGVGGCRRPARDHGGHMRGAQTGTRCAADPSRPRGAGRATGSWPRLRARCCRQGRLPDSLCGVRERGSQSVPRPSDGPAPSPLSRVRVGPQSWLRNRGPPGGATEAWAFTSPPQELRGGRRAFTV